MSGKYPFLILPLFVLVLVNAVPQESREAGKLYPPGAILAAAYRGDVEMVRKILADGPDKDARDSFGSTALHLAIYQPNVTVVKLLLEYGFAPNAAATRNGYTPLHNAVAANNVEAARILLQYGADKSIKSVDGLTPLEKARKEEKRPLILLLYR